jgi:threonine aldolase
VIDLRSDTVSKPTAGMRAAIAAAAVGDEQLKEDPTVNELQRRMAEALGMQAAVFLPTATMANQIALRVLGRPGGTLLAEEQTHVLIYEQGGPAIHSGLVMHGLAGEAGRIAPEQLRSVTLSPGSVVVLENTHRSAGGRVWPLDAYSAVIRAARELEMHVHLDGARLFNAAAAADLSPSAWAEVADSVTICFSKGLGCPLGAVLAGSEDFIEQAWEGKHLFGGAMRQAGIVAAAALYALDHHVPRLADDHARARRLAEGLHAAGVPVDLPAVETNFVGIDLDSFSLDAATALSRLRAEGVALGLLRPNVLRAATHLDLTDDHVDTALEVIPRALGLRASAKRPLAEDHHKSPTALSGADDPRSRHGRRGDDADVTQHHPDRDLLRFYTELYDEDARLRTSPHGRLEFDRTRDLLLGRLPPPPARILDVGGGTGVHAEWLSAAGYEVDLVDLVAEHVERAARLAGVTASVGDARRLTHRSDCADAVLLLGPLYHLVEASDREAALAEARRVTRPGGLVAAAAISRHAGLLDLAARGLLDEQTEPLLRVVIATGRHDGRLGFAPAHFHTPEELAEELEDAGLGEVVVVGVEGPTGPALDAHGPERVSELLPAAIRSARVVERDPALIAASAHLLGFGRA